MQVYKLTRRIVTTIFVASYINDTNGHRYFQSNIYKIHVKYDKCKVKIHIVETTQNSMFIFYVLY